MPRLPADPIGRLPVLEAARAGCRRGTVLNFADMAKVAGMTPRNLKIIIDADPKFPVKVRGDMGVPWEFNPRAVLNHLIKQAHAAKSQRERRMASVSRLAGLGAEAGAASSGDHTGSGSGSAAHLLEGAKAVSAVVDAQAKVRGEKQAQGKLIAVEQVHGLLWDMMTTMQSETLAISSKMDPAGQMDAALRGAIDEHLRNVLLEVRGKLEAALEKWRGSRG